MTILTLQISGQQQATAIAQAILGTRGAQGPISQPPNRMASTATTTTTIPQQVCYMTSATLYWALLHSSTLQPAAWLGLQASRVYNMWLNLKHESTVLLVLPMSQSWSALVPLGLNSKTQGITFKTGTRRAIYLQVALAMIASMVPTSLELERERISELEESVLVQVNLNLSEDWLSNLACSSARHT